MRIAIASGKGGTGKTTIATNLASVWAETEHVALVDLDVEEPNAGLFVKGELVHQETVSKPIPKWDSGNCCQSGICRRVCKFNSIVRLGNDLLVFPELCHSCYACVELCPSGALAMIEYPIGVLSVYSSGSLDFVESRMNVGQEKAVPLIAHAKDYAAKKYNSSSTTIFDSPPGTTCPVIETIKDVDFVVLVAEPTPFGLHDLKLAVDVTKKLEKPMAVVVNRWGIGDGRIMDFCAELEIDIIEKLPNSKEFAHLYSGGNLLYLHNEKYREGIIKIKNYLLEKLR